MRHLLLITVAFSLLIIGLTTSVEIAKIAPTEYVIQSIYKEGAAILFFLDRNSSFYRPYSFSGASRGFIIRKAEHFLVYRLLAGIIFIILPLKSLWLKGLMAFSSTSLIGLIDEVHQHFLLNRSGRILDVYINMAGSFVSVFLLLTLCILLKFFKKTKNHSGFRSL